MKERTPEQLKGQIRHFSTQRGLQPQEVLQMFLLESVLDRLSNSKYSRNFILKGGMLISSMMGIMERTTMDMDTTVNGINMDEDEISNIIKEILLIDVGDGIKFEFEKLEPIIRRNSSARLKGRVPLEGLRIYLRVSANKNISDIEDL